MFQLIASKLEGKLEGNVASSEFSFVKPKIQNLVTKQRSKRERYTDKRVTGLTLELNSNGHGAFYFRYSFNRKRKQVKLVNWDFKQYKERGEAWTAYQNAEKLYREHKELLSRGVDPKAEIERHENVRKEAERLAQLEKIKNVSLWQFVLSKYEPHLKRSHRKSSYIESMRILRNNYKALHDMLINSDDWENEIGKHITQCIDKGNKKSTILKQLNTLKTLFNYAVTEKYLMTNPLGSLSAKSIKISDDEEGAALNYLTMEQKSDFLQALLDLDNKLKRTDMAMHYGDYFTPLIILALNTGLRKNALLNLKWSDIDCANKHFQLRAAISKNRKHYTLPLTGVAVSCLRKWKAQTAHQSNEYIFTNQQTGRPITDIKKRFAALKKHSGINHITFHGLRHTFASHLVMSGVDLFTVKGLLTHKNIKATEIYAHLAPDYKLKEVQAIDGAFDLPSSDNVITHNFTKKVN